FLDEGEYCQSVPCPAATVKGCKNREAGQAFIDFLRTKAAQEVLRNSGFTGLSDAKCLR
ncbi:MAG: solute-binding protein, partial [Armatimonadetes bacterium]|nr:solute-binding protein [Armatimonadota bacterium]